MGNSEVIIYDAENNSEQRDPYYIRKGGDMTGINVAKEGSVFRIWETAEEQEAYNFMLNTAPSAGPYSDPLEIAAWVTESKIVVLPYRNNLRGGSHTGSIPGMRSLGFRFGKSGNHAAAVFYDETGQRYLEAVVGLVHVHIDNNDFSSSGATAGNSGRATGDIENSDFYETPIFILFRRQKLMYYNGSDRVLRTNESIYNISINIFIEKMN